MKMGLDLGISGNWKKGKFHSKSSCLDIDILAISKSKIFNDSQNYIYLRIAFCLYDSMLQNQS